MWHLDVFFQNDEHGIPLPCQYCNEKLPDESSRKDHIRLKHRDRRKQPVAGVCEICNTYQKNFQKHMVITNF
jgi:hypothetical protein